MAENTKDWDLYEAGKNYNNKLDPPYYETVDANLDFYSGNQWRNLPDSNMPKPVFNIIKRVIAFQVASLTTSKVKLHFEPLLPNTGADELARMANEQISALLEKFKIEFKIKDALFDAAITGDMCAHFYFDVTKQPYGAMSDVKGEICMELVDGTNVFFGNANNPSIDAQPYIIISGRDIAKNLQEEAKRYEANEQDISNITEDSDYGWQAGESSKIEVETDEYGKALYIIKYKKVKKKRAKTENDQPVLDENGKQVMEEYTTITASKSVKDTYIYEDVDTELSHYPIAWNNWEKQKNQYHGRALCTGMLPNQIFINRMFAMVMYHLMMTAFPKAIYNTDYIATWDNQVGAGIGVSELGPEVPIKNIAGYLEPGNMSNQIVQVIEMAMQYTKETLGISDAALGQIDPKNTSAIIAVQKSSAIPLENPKANLYEWIEDSGKILFDMMGTYYGLRPVVLEQDGVKQAVEFDFSQFKRAWMNVKADVGEASYWSEIAAQQTLDNLLTNQHMDIIEYLQRVPDEYIPQKEQLIQQIQQRMADPFDVISQLNPDEQIAFLQAPPEARKQMLAQIQGQQPQAPAM